jgi:hypothetical protein
MKFRQFLPFENYTLKTNLSIADVHTKISNCVESKKRDLRVSVFNENQTKPYEGQIIGDTFIINRIINNRNSFLPIITGRILNYYGQTIIKIKMRLPISVIIFLFFWFGIFGSAFISIPLKTLFKFKEITKHTFLFNILFPFGLIVFVWLLTLIPFKIESNKSKKFLYTLFEGQ